MSDGITDAYIWTAGEVGTIQVKVQDNKPTTVIVENSQQGLKFDGDKPMLDLVPSSLIDAVGDILTMGAKKYSAQNWRKGLKYSRVIAALMRHLNAWREGDSIDKESQKSHMWHVACNVAFLIEFEANPEKYKDFDDRWTHEKE